MSNNNHRFNSLPVDSPNNKSKDLLSEYNIIKVIGRGNFSIVKLAEHKLTKEKVAIKIMKKSQIINQDDLIRIDREIQMLKSLNHENVIKIYNIFEDSKRFYIIMEHCENGELFDRIVEKKRLSEEESAIFYYQLINGLEYIHKKNIIHRDLKPENLLLSKDDILKIIDFGLSNYSRYDILLDTPCGSPCYASPEMVNGQRYNGFLTDIWSTGIILYAMICGYLPFEDNNDGKLFEKIFYCQIHYPNHIGELPLDLLKKIIVSEPCKRITLEQIKQHPFYLKGKTLFNQKNTMKKDNNKKISVKNITQNINYKILKNILKKGYKLKDDFNNHNKNTDNDLSDYKPCISRNKHNILSKVYKLNTTEIEKNKKIDNEEEKNDKGNNLKDNFNGYNTCKKNQSKIKLNYKTPTDTIPKKQKFISIVFNCTNSKNKDIKEIEMNSKKSTEKINKIKKIQKPYIYETSYKKENNFGKLYIFNEPKTVRNKVRVQKITLPKKNDILIEKHNHTIDLDYEQMYNNDNKINFIYNNKVNKKVEEQKCVSAPKNRDILFYSLINKYPHNNHRKKNIININQTEEKIYDSNEQNNKIFKENQNINITTINQNNEEKNKILQYFNKKLINYTFNKKIKNDEYIYDKVDLFNLSKDKRDKALKQNNNNIEKYKKINNYFNKVTRILQNKYNDSQRFQYKRKLNSKIKSKEQNIDTQREKNDLEDDIDKKNPKKNKANVIDIKNIKHNMKFYKNVNYIIFNNNYNENNKSRKINSDKSNISIETNDKNDKLFEAIKIQNSNQAYDLTNSRKENDLYFEQNRNKEQSLKFNTFKDVKTNKNYIKKIDIKNNKTLNVMRNNNIVKRTCDILNNDSLERINLTSRNKRVLKGKFESVNNESYSSIKKSHFLFDDINRPNTGRYNNIDELQKLNCETQNYNSIINYGKDVNTFPYTNYLENNNPMENYSLLNPNETHRIHISTIGKQYSNILNE